MVRRHYKAAAGRLLLSIVASPLWAGVARSAGGEWRSTPLRSRRLASDDMPPELQGFDLLGEGWCDGDALYRSMNYMSTIITDGSETFEDKSVGCAELCDRAALLLDRCMGFQVYTDGKCRLYDRDWTVNEKATAEAALSNVSTVKLEAKGVQSFPGKHLSRLNSDPYLLAKASSKPACYRRQISCEATVNCTALNRYPCQLGKLANTCDNCFPWHTGAAGQSNATCTPASRTPPTLRLAFASGAFFQDDHDENDGINTAFLAAAYSLKWAWENQYTFLSQPLVPPENRQDFKIEFYSFTENITLLEGLTVGGTEQVSETSVVPGLRAIAGASGGSFSSTLQLREAAPGSRVHAVIGSRSTSSGEEAEETLLRMSEEFQTPVLGWKFDSPDLKSPFYIRTNRVALNAGSAIAKLLEIIGYTSVTVVEQAKTPQVAKQLKSVMLPSTDIKVETLSEQVRGPCVGGKQCSQAILETWKKVRADDVRIVIHEHGGHAFEFVLLMANDLLGDKTLYIQTGFPCSYINFYDTIAWAQADYRALDNANFTDCQACPNIMQYLGVSDEDRKNWTYVAEYLYSDKNPYVALQPLWCPQFPTVEHMLNCSYCHGLDSVFASPECEVLQKRFEVAMSRSICIEPDFAENIADREAYQSLFDCLDTDKKACHNNYTSTGLLVSQKLLANGLPASYLDSYLPDGRLWNRGLQSSLQRPFGLTAAWTDIDLCEALGIRCWVNNIESEIVDAIMTAILGYNEFVRLGGDSDPDSSPTADPKSERQGNSVAAGWKKFLLNTDFDGFNGRVQYVSEGIDVGERNVKYKVYQITPGTSSGCFLRTASQNASFNNQEIRFVSSTWNFKYVPIQQGLSGELKIAPSDNDMGCFPFPEGFFSGKIAFIKRGGCMFGTKLKYALETGAMGLVVLNVASDFPIFMSANDPTLTISGVCIGKSDGTPIWDAVASGQSVSVTLQAATNCVDPTYSITQGLTVYLLGMSYDLATNEVLDTTGKSVSCTGVPGNPESSCSGIVFNDGTSDGPGTLVPPRQQPEECGDGYEYSIALRECFACQSGKYRLASESAKCLPCLPGTFASGTSNSKCQRCPSGTYSLAVAPSCEICSAGLFSGSGSDTCLSCEAGYFSSTQGSSQCAICQAGSFSTKAADGCSPCTPGNYSGHGSAQCYECDAGFFTSMSGQSECNICLPGSYSWKAAGNCTLCEPGRYTEVEGAAGCLDCAVGRYSSLSGASTSCTPCRKGSYSAVPARTACTVCNGSLITPGVGQQFESDCMCPDNFFRPANDYLGECLPCPKAMRCVIGSDMENLNKVLAMSINPQTYLSLSTTQKDELYGPFPVLEVGYMSLPSKPLWVYMCQSEGACPGGLPNSCGKHMSEIACGLCESGYHRGDHSCLECSSVETSMFLFPTLPLLFGPLCIFLLYVKMQDPVYLWGSPANGVLIIAFILLFHCQVIGVVSIFNLLYPTVVGSTWKHTDFLLKGLTIFRADCAGVNTFEATFITNMCIPIFLILLFLVTYAMNRTFCYVFETYSSGSSRDSDVPNRRPTERTLSAVHKTKFANRLIFHATTQLNPNIFFSTYGTLVFSFSISIASIAFSLFKCYSHPNGEDRSLFQAPEILCHEEQWDRMLGIAIVGLLLYCVLPLVCTSIVLWQAPSRFRDITFRQRWKFLISKFRPEVWWWGNVTIVKGIMINLSITSFEKGIEQIWWTSLILLVFTLLTIFAQPWRHVYANIVDTISSCCLACAVGLTCWFAPPPETEDEEANHGTGIVLITILPFVAFLWYMVVALQDICNKNRRQTEQLVLGYRLRTIFQAYLETGPAEQHKFCTRLTEHDVDALNTAYTIISAEMFSTMPRHLKGLRLISAPSKSGTRFDLSELETHSSPWAGIEQCNNPKMKEVQSMIKVPGLKEQISSTLTSKTMSRGDFEEVCKSDLKLTPRTTDAMFEVMNIHEGRFLEPEDVKTVMSALSDRDVARYAKCQTLPKVDEGIESKMTVADTNGGSSEFVKPDMVSLSSWEDIENEMASLHPAPRQKIFNMREPRRPEVRLKRGATTPPVLSPRAPSQR